MLGLGLGLAPLGFALAPLPAAPVVVAAASAPLARARVPLANDPWAPGGGNDLFSTVSIALTALAGAGAGVALIGFTENAGVKNEETSNSQPCVVCKGTGVEVCSICEGTGVDQFADLVAGVQEATAVAVGAAPTPSNVVTIEDWEAGPKQVVMYEEILSKYPVKSSGADKCETCDGRGVVICDNCSGTGIQPRFLERYSPDDFMD